MLARKKITSIYYLAGFQAFYWSGDTVKDPWLHVEIYSEVEFYPILQGNKREGWDPPPSLKYIQGLLRDQFDPGLIAKSV